MGGWRGVRGCGGWRGWRVVRGVVGVHWERDPDSYSDTFTTNAKAISHIFIIS